MEKVSILNIVACKNGWAVYGHHRSENCMPLIDYVFNDAEALGKAVVNLVTKGTIEKPVRGCEILAGHIPPDAGDYIVFHPDGHELFVEVKDTGAIWRWSDAQKTNHLATWSSWKYFAESMRLDFEKAKARDERTLYPTFARL
jgi:hypothetical protein